MRGFLGKAMLVACSIAVTLVVVDLVLLVIHGPVRVVENFYEPDARFGYRMRPNLAFTFANPYHGYHGEVQTNSRGLRGPEVRVPKPAGTFRILLLGDSMTAGLEVNEDQTFAAVCERRLGGNRSVEVINAGVRGYDLDNIVAYLHAEGLGLDPDIVFYFFTDNDLTHDIDPAPKGADMSRGFRIAGWASRLATYSHLTYRFEILRQRLAMRRARDQNTAAGPVFLPGGLVAFFQRAGDPTVPAFGLTAERIASLATMCAEHRARFVLAGAPQKEEIDPESQRFIADHLAGHGQLDMDGLTHWLDAVAMQLAIERFDPIPAFRAGLPHDRNYWFHKDNHLNPRGHQLLGQLLAERVRALAGWQTVR